MNSIWFTQAPYLTLVKSNDFIMASYITLFVLTKLGTYTPCFYCILQFVAMKY